jgi:hypothetical protein
MKHFHRTSVMPDVVMAEADAFFPTIGLKCTASGARSRNFEGVVGTPEDVVSLRLTVKMEGGHYTFVEAQTTAQGESRLDRNVKKFFVRLHRLADARHAIGAAY